MLKDCMDRYPEKEWDERNGDYSFSQVVFADYEECADRISSRLHERDFINRYFDHCREKVVSVAEEKTEAEPLVPNPDVRGNVTKPERFINTARHMQHHAAQLAYGCGSQPVEKWIGSAEGMRNEVWPCRRNERRIVNGHSYL